MPRRLTKIFNIRTLIALIISQAASYYVIQNGIKSNFNLVLFGLAISFPIVFSIQSAFKRRDRAIEYFSLFKAGLVSILQSFRVSEDLPPERKMEVSKILQSVANQLITQLENHISDYAPMQQSVDKIVDFIEANRENLSNRNILRMIRYVRDITMGAAYLIALVKHRTMAGIRFFALFFLLLFPIIQAPILNHALSPLVSNFTIHVVSAVTSLILITLSNFQTSIEYPFDADGIDNIQVRDFELNLPAAPGA